MKKLTDFLFTQIEIGLIFLVLVGVYFLIGCLEIEKNLLFELIFALCFKVLLKREWVNYNYLISKAIKLGSL